MKSNIKSQLKIIEHKQRELDEINRKLKSDFVGLDTIIDNICEAIKVWYIFPELQIRPTILCLWGMTGVGKTDLVRKMVSYMNMQDRFLEIEMGDRNGSTIQSKLESSSLSPEDQCLLFLDEFQRFRTVDDQGGDVEVRDYGDVWTLLSDGKFQVDLSRKSEIVDSLLYNKYYEEQNDFWASAGDKKERAVEKKRKDAMVYKTPVYTARKLKRTFKLEESIEEIMKFDESKINKLYDEASKNPKIFEPEPFKKMLIIVSGNLDEAYRMSARVEDADIDADFYHALSKRLTVINIKASLMRRFKPEQIARLGNTHILYPCLSKSNYEKIIVMKCNQIREVVEKLKGIKISYDPSVYDVMYKNGVFPTQGVRPLLSTITNILSCALPNFLFVALKTGQSSISIRYENGNLVSRIGNKIHKHEVPTVLETIKEGISDNTKAHIAVHELGHGIIHALLFNVPPSVICSTSVSPYVDGFVIGSNSLGTKGTALKRLRVFFGGKSAEELVFDSDSVGEGSASDIAAATEQAFEYICINGFSTFKAKVTTQLGDCDNKMSVLSTEIGNQVHDLLEQAHRDAAKLLRDNIHIFKELLEIFLKKDELSENDFVEVFARHGKTLNPHSFDEIVTPQYSEMVNSFLKKTERPLISTSKIPYSVEMSSDGHVHIKDMCRPDEIFDVPLGSE